MACRRVLAGSCRRESAPVSRGPLGSRQPPRLVRPTRLTRGNVPCALQFCLRGPRNVRLAAIWVADQNVVYLYDARGERYAKLRLTNRLALQEEARAA
jgi:hypothetical protein